MNYKHEILYLNSSRTYVRVGNTWYDNSSSFEYNKGEAFLIGKIEEVLSYEEYTKQYPESKTEMGPRVSDKLSAGGYIRKTSTGVDKFGNKASIVEYGVNPQQFIMEQLTADTYD